jgi:SAM-dependent methyltransferase
METVNSQTLDPSQLQPQFQWHDFLARKEDLYANSKYSVLLKWVAEVRASEKIETSLIVGCGSGELALMLAESGLKVTAIDIDEPTIELAKKLAGPEAHSVTYMVSNLQDYKSTMKYDLVVATDVIEHIEDDRLAAQKIVELTKEQKFLIITVPALQSIFGIHDENLGHFRRYAKAELENLFKNQTKILKSRFFGFIFVPITFFISRIFRRPYPLQKAGETKLSRVLRRILTLIFWVEQRVAGPVGTSLLLLARKQ